MKISYFPALYLDPRNTTISTLGSTLWCKSYPTSGKSVYLLRTTPIQIRNLHSGHGLSFALGTALHLLKPWAWLHQGMPSPPAISVGFLARRGKAKLTTFLIQILDMITSRVRGDFVSRSSYGILSKPRSSRRRWGPNLGSPERVYYWSSDHFTSLEASL